MTTRVPMFAVLAAALLAPLPARAVSPAACQVAESQVHNTFPLRRTSQAVQKKELRILVIGAGSSVLPGSSGVSSSYPARLQSALKEKIPNLNVALTADVKAGRTASEMAAGFAKALDSAKPDLVVWQTGTVDAVKGIDPDQFNAAVGKGLDLAAAAGIDVVVMNQQFSPRTESLIALTNYSESLRWVALQHEVPLFDRFQVMKTWNEMGTFDLYAATKNLDTAARVHDCIGRLLADLIVEAATPGGKPALDIR